MKVGSLEVLGLAVTATFGTTDKVFMILIDRANGTYISTTEVTDDTVVLFELIGLTAAMLLCWAIQWVDALPERHSNGFCQL